MRKTGQDIICITCGTAYYVSGCRLKDNPRFCSPKCRRHTSESKARMRKAAIGRIPWNSGLNKSDPRVACYASKCSQTKTGTIPWNKGKKGLIAWNKGKKLPQIAKERHWNWQGGKTDMQRAFRNSLEYKQWRLTVFQRDRFRCVECGYRSCKPRDVVADHIKPFCFFPELRLDLSNGRTLCRPCDKQIAFNYERDRYLYESAA